MNCRVILIDGGRSLLMILAVLLLRSSWAQNNFLYTNDDQSSNTVSAFSVASDGTLTPVAGSPFATNGVGFPGGPFATNRIGIAVTDNFLFVSNTGSNDVSVFRIDPSTGGLTPVVGSPFATKSLSGDLGIAVSVTPDGRYLVATNTGSDNITVFSIGSNGSLIPIAGSPFPTLASPDGIRISPNGKFLAVAETAFPPSQAATNQVEVFSIASNGALTSLGAFAGGGSGSLTDVDIDCSSGFLYGGEANDTSTIVDVYNIASNGSLTSITGSPFIAGPGDNSNVVLLSPDDKTLFVSNQFSRSISAFFVAPNGSLSQITGSPFTLRGSVALPVGMATNQDGSLLYVADNFKPAVSVFRVESNRTLTEITGSPFFTGQGFGLHSLTAFPRKPCMMPVSIEIKPPSPVPVPINTQTMGKIPVAILSTLNFNAVSQVNPKSLTFGHTGNEFSLAFCDTRGEDVNGDGLVDLVCYFYAWQTGLRTGDTSALLRGQTMSGEKIQASESIRTVPR